MPEGPYRWFVVAELVLAAVTFVALLFVVAPYGGRHGRPGWGPTVPARVGWIVMEAPASLAFLAFYLLGTHRADAALLFTCNGRGRHLFGVPDHDSGVVDPLLGPLPLAGAFCAGELGPIGGRNFLHGFTASLALFR